MPNQPLDVGAVLPVRNEAGHPDEESARIRAALDASEHTFGIIVADGDSANESSYRFRPADRISPLSFASHLELASARKNGTRKARARVVVWTDADMTYPNDRTAAPVRSRRNSDQVVGARTMKSRPTKLLPTPATSLIRRNASFLTNTTITYPNSCLKAFRHYVADRFDFLLLAGFSHVTPITMALFTNGYTAGYLPIDYFPRDDGSNFLCVSTPAGM